MKIISTNLGVPTTIIWNGKEEKTGIYKYPTNNSLFLGKNDVTNDTVIDRKHHGGQNKACYLFSADQYAYWKELYPDLNWNWGMFGENLTVEGMDESQIRIGNIYKIGSALVQVSQPREPCYKLGIRFKNQKVIKEFVERGFPGAYVKIIEEGTVQKGDPLILKKESENPLTVSQFYNLLYAKEKNINTIELAMNNNGLPQYKKEKLRKDIT